MITWLIIVWLYAVVFALNLKSKRKAFINGFVVQITIKWDFDYECNCAQL